MSKNMEKIKALQTDKTIERWDGLRDMISVAI